MLMCYYQERSIALFHLINHYVDELIFPENIPIL